VVDVIAEYSTEEPGLPEPAPLPNPVQAIATGKQSDASDYITTLELVIRSITDENGH
jgi:hypothetical protein